MINGILNVYKEKSFTSHDVVAKLRGILKQKKIGHTGTLDPDAEGVLPVCLGKGTKVCDFLADEDKTYVAELLLGTVTDTQDTSGTVLQQNEINVTSEAVREAVQAFVGEYDQIPPMYSARKVNGKKLYELARAGIEVERKPKRVNIYEIRILNMNLPVVTMEVTCSKGTYIRTLCQDIGEQLGCGGCMQKLLRTRVGSFSIEESLTLGQMEQLADAGTIQDKILAIDSLFQQYPALYVKEMFHKLAYNGNALKRNQCVGKAEKDSTDSLVRIYDSLHSFIGIYQWNEEQRAFFPVKMFWETT